MHNGDLCEADEELPDGNTDYDINNCDAFDVFKCVRGKHFYMQYLFHSNLYKFVISATYTIYFLLYRIRSSNWSSL